MRQNFCSSQKSSHGVCDYLNSLQCVYMCVYVYAYFCMFSECVGMNLQTVFYVSACYISQVNVLHYCLCVCRCFFLHIYMMHYTCSYVVQQMKKKTYNVL